MSMINSYKKLYIIFFVIFNLHITLSKSIVTAIKKYNNINP